MKLAVFGVEVCAHLIEIQIACSAQRIADRMARQADWNTDFNQTRIYTQIYTVF